MNQVACSVRRAAALCAPVALLAACRGEGDLETAQELPARATPVAGLRLTEVRLLAADDAPAFVELGNFGPAAQSLDGVVLAVEQGAAIELPRGVTLEPGALFVVSFDGGDDVEAGVAGGGWGVTVPDSGDDPPFLENGRMVGRYDGDAYNVRWSICPAGTPCPPPPGGA